MTTKSFKLFDHIRITELNECTTLRKPITTFCVRVIPVKVEDRKKKRFGWRSEWERAKKEKETSRINKMDTFLVRIHTHTHGHRRIQHKTGNETQERQVQQKRPHTYKIYELILNNKAYLQLTQLCSFKVFWRSFSI